MVKDRLVVKRTRLIPAGGETTELVRILGWWVPPGAGLFPRSPKQPVQSLRHLLPLIGILAADHHLLLSLLSYFPACLHWQSASLAGATDTEYSMLSNSLTYALVLIACRLKHTHTFFTL